MCIECGYKKDFTQWVEIHLMLSELVQVIMRKHTMENHRALGLRIHIYLMEEKNDDEVTRFWAELLKILNT